MSSFCIFSMTAKMRCLCPGAPSSSSLAWRTIFSSHGGELRRGLILRSLGVFWEFNKTTLVGLLGGLAIIGVAFLTLGAFGRVEPATGRIVDFIIAGSRGMQPVAGVEVDGRFAHVPLSAGGACRLGGEIALTRQRRLQGWRYRIALVPHPCGRTD